MIEHLKETRNSKLRKPLSHEKQMLQLAKDDMSFKKQMLAEMKEINQSNAAQMNILTNSLVNLTNALTAALSQPHYIPQPAFNQLQQVQYTPAQGGSQGVLDQIKSANQRPYQEVRRTHIADFEESDDEITYIDL
eukprot:gene3612-13046_t